MFEVQENGPRPAFTYFVQQIMAVLAVPGAAFLFGAVSVAMPSTIWFVGFLFELPMFVAGFVLGYVLPKSSLTAQVACWTWCLPLFFFALIFMSEVNRAGFSPALSFFFAPNPRDDDTLATLFFTMPAWSAVSYSIGAFFKGRALSQISAPSNT